MRKKWEYIGKREILRRVSALGYPVASGKLCSYSKFEGVEWVESAKIKITAQRRRLATDHTKVGKHNKHLHPVRWEKLS